MNAIELANRLNLNIANKGDGENREIKGIYCCDLLSIVMGRAKQNDALITVMCNINTVATASLADISCIIIPEGLHLDNEAIKKAQEHGICVLESDLPAFETSVKVASEVGLLV